MPAVQTEPLRVRPFQIGDLPQIAEIRNESIALSPDFYSMTVDRFRPVASEPAGMMSEILVAETDDEVVGYLHVYTDPSLLDRGRINLDAIHVHPRHQRRGVGGKLLEVAEQRGRDWGGRYLTIAIPPIEGSQTFLLGHGFQLVRYFWKMIHRDLAALPAPEFPAGVSTRTFRPREDEGVLTDLINACFAQNWDFVPFTRQDLEKWNAQSDFQPEGCLFALRGGRAIGVATTLNDRQRLATTHEDAARLFEFGVLPEERGHGIGYQLLLASAQFARSQGLGSLELVTDGQDAAAKHMYEHAGFQEKRAILVFHRAL